LAAHNRRAVALPDTPHGLGKEHSSVHETGIGAMIDRFGRLVEAVDRGDEHIGTIRFMGTLNRPEFEATVEGVTHVIPPGIEEALPNGGQRLWCFDTTLRFPVLIVTLDNQGQEVEYYCFDRFLFTGPIADDEFNPANLGKR
jgi:hypothetical protein